MWDEMPQDIKDELTDPSFITRKHNSRATYALGCRGPLCRKAERDRGRLRNEERSGFRGNEYEPALEYRVEEHPKMDEFIEWHTQELDKRRQERSEELREARRQKALKKVLKRAG